ncbi:MAG TPA: THUMP domain-containing protein [Thermoplasmata archaeon]|nr:THUMP domain-containing protein [Thermoplasmata archaeon]
MPTLLVRYGEIGLKSERVRRRFEAALVGDIKHKHATAGVPCIVSSGRGRIFVDSNDWRRSCEILSRTFGVVSFSPTTRVSSDLEQLSREVVRFAEPLMFEEAAFAIRARRSGSHPYTSQTLCEKIGDAIRSANKERRVKVDLDEPDVELFIEVRGRDAYLFSSVLPGPGGMPKSTQGRVLAMLSSERGIAAAWLLMKRGCTVVAACGDKELADQLVAWDADIKIIAPEGDVFMKAADERCLAVVMDWGVKELDSNPALKGPVPVFYPLSGLDDGQACALVDRVTRA